MGNDKKNNNKVGENKMKITADINDNYLQHLWVLDEELQFTKREMVCKNIWVVWGKTRDVYCNEKVWEFKFLNKGDALRKLGHIKHKWGQTDRGKCNDRLISCGITHDNLFIGKNKNNIGEN
tara:strand:+ start:4579 stop:4944 length:366 start_codon:yes stop_codon:yes gene_type:complete